MFRNYLFIILSIIFSISLFSQDRDRQITFVNEGDYVSSGGTLATFTEGQTFSITLNYSTGITGDAEEDLFYGAMMVRQVDENFAPVITSSFQVVIDGSASNADEITFDYTLPTTFDDGSAIPKTADLPAGHSLLLVIFIAVDNATGFADDNTQIIVESGTLSTDDEKLNKLVVGPNPFDNKLSIIGTSFNSNNYEAVIYNSLGQIVYANKKTKTTEINLETLDSGIYYLRLSSGANNKSKTISIIKK